MVYEEILLSSQGAIGTITLNHDRKRNALGRGLIHEVITALNDLVYQQARVIVLRARPGAKVWPAGHDVGELPQPGRDPLTYDDPLEQVIRAIQRCPAPVIAMLEGVAGALVFYAVDTVIDRRGGHGRKSPHGEHQLAGSASAIVLGTVLDGIPESFVLGASLIEGPVATAVVGGVFVSNVPEALSGTSGLLQAGWTRGRVFAMWSAVVAMSVLSALSAGTRSTRCPPRLERSSLPSRAAPSSSCSRTRSCPRRSRWAAVKPACSRRSGSLSAVLKRLQAGEEFSKAAREVSTGPEAAKGGDLGVFTRGVMPEAFDRIVFSLAEGKTSKVVKNPYGFHLFKVLKKEKGRWIEFAEVKEKIRADLAKGREEQGFRKWLGALKSEARIRIDEERLKQVKIEEPRTEEPKPGQAPASPGKG